MYLIVRSIWTLCTYVCISACSIIPKLYIVSVSVNLNCFKYMQLPFKVESGQQEKAQLKARLFKTDSNKIMFSKKYNGN